MSKSEHIGELDIVRFKENYYNIDTSLTGTVLFDYGNDCEVEFLDDTGHNIFLDKGQGTNPEGIFMVNKSLLLLVKKFKYS